MSAQSGSASPSITDYCDWAEGMGCTIEIRDVAEDGFELKAVTIAAAASRVVEIVLDLDEPLMSTTVARLDRRLGLKSRMFV